MKKILVNYADKTYSAAQKLNSKMGLEIGGFDEVRSFSSSDIDKKFYDENKKLLNDKEMGYSYLARLAVKNPMLVPKLMFRLVVKPDTKVFQKLKSVIGPLKRDKINV